jgi:hypothetical protein
MQVPTLCWVAGRLQMVMYFENDAAELLHEFSINLSGVYAFRWGFFWLRHTFIEYRNVFISAVNCKNVANIPFNNMLIIFGNDCNKSKLLSRGN